MNNLNKKSETKPKIAYIPSFEPREQDLELTAMGRSVDRLVKMTLDRVADETNTVLEFGNMVSEEDKWEQVKATKHDFRIIEETIAKVLKTPILTNRNEKPDLDTVQLLVENLLNYVNILDVELNSNKAIIALGREVVYLLNTLSNALKNEIGNLLESIKNDPDNLFEAVDNFTQFKNDFFDMIYSGFITEDKSTEPVQVQIFDNLTKSLWIPPYPLADIVPLYDEFESREPNEDYAKIMKERFKSFVEPKKAELKEQIKKEKERALQLKENLTKKVSPEFQELLSRYADYWISMTPEKLYEYIIRRRAVENLAEGRVTLAQMKELYKVWFEMANARPTGQIDAGIPNGEKPLPGENDSPYEDLEITKE